jgi:putative Mg2+ transporter-C (MgtC) family protein
MHLVFAPINLAQLSLRLACALLAGAIIGWERETKGKPAGFRTNLLVSFGAALFVLIPIQAGLAQYSVDALARVIQGVITGVGFIGAGTILRSPKVRGLTSAAAIWVSASLGISAACGLWPLSLGGAVIGWLILRVLEMLEPS